MTGSMKQTTILNVLTYLCLSIFFTTWTFSDLVHAHGVMLFQSSTDPISADKDGRVSAGRGFKEIQSVEFTLDAPEGLTVTLDDEATPSWSVFLQTTVTHVNGNFLVQLENSDAPSDAEPVASDEATWGSGTGNDWDVQTMSTIFKDIAPGAYRAVLYMRCGTKCEATSARIILQAVIEHK